MPNGRSHKEYDNYGQHSYPDKEGTSDCSYGCGCWMGPARSDGPVGIDPFGHCPLNPIDGTFQEDNFDYEDCVNGRIRDLESKVYELHRFREIVEGARVRSRIALQKEIERIQQENFEIKNLLKESGLALKHLVKAFNEVENEE